MITLKPVGWVRGGRRDAVDDHWGGERSVIELAAELPESALFGLDTFSHAEIIFFFDKVPEAEIETGARHPRGNPDWPLTGIFAQRGKNRPNRLGLCTCSILGVSRRQIEVGGLDAIDGTPVLDIKPVMREFLPRGAVRQPGWASELMKDYW
ncbi:SAM-dependent methyltransferase [Hyphomonas sp. WL0036]|uniref:SAM-dependent methyltransferase n=1 Tax=Hyphomonas sediminis TaxID=2866160 RepID=UPI001C7EA9CD|nr:SAM-dependent methyltransferase [Hyphomonas sediminis]MBY9066071.1 SAM-dependent methyltransferase [Hyphomonas sediminis]